MPAIMEKQSFENFSPKKGKVAGKKSGSSEDEGSREGKESHKPGKGKRSFLTKAKRFEKQGKLGRGFQVDTDIYSYFVRVFELLRRDDFESDDEREMFVENALGSETEGKEVDLSSNQLVSRVIESVLPMASEDTIYRFCTSFTPSLRTIVSDPFASHVLEKLLEVTSHDKWRQSEKLTTWFENTSMFVLNNFEDFTFDKYGSFVMKKVLECLSGNVEAQFSDLGSQFKVLKNSKINMNTQGVREPNPKWEGMLHTFAKRFAAWPQFNDLKERAETSRLVQNIIQTVNSTKIEGSKELTKSLILRVLETFPDTLEVNDNGHRTLEVCLSVADEKMFDVIYKKYYKGCLADYCTGACYTILKLIQYTPNKTQFEKIFDELLPVLDVKIMQEGKDGVTHNLAQQCVNHKSRQNELFEILKKAAKGENLVIALVAMKTQKFDGIKEEKQTDTKFSTSYFGTRTVQILMDFSDPTDVINCITGLDKSMLKTFSLDPKASFILTKFFKTWNVPQNQKEKLLGKLKDSLVELASTKFGSRIIDVIWLWANISYKKIIAEALSQRIPQLAANKYGRFFVENFGLNAFKRDRKEWTEHMTSQDKRKSDAKIIAEELGLTVNKTPKQEKTTPEDKPKSGKKKNKKSMQMSEETPIVAKEEINDSAQTPKKKKNRKSEAVTDHEETLILDASNVIEGSDETPKKKKNKKRKSEATVTEDSVVLNQTQEDTDYQTPKKKKKKDKTSELEKSQLLLDDDATLGERETPKKKKKKDKTSELEKSQLLRDDEATMGDLETPKKKKKKDRKSENSFSAITVSEEAKLELSTSTPSKKKKKNRKSEM